MSYVLITGCNGFIGRKLTVELLSIGFKVLGLSTSKEAAISHKNFKYISVDLTQSLLVEKLFKEYPIDSVIHLAAIAHLKGRKDISWNEFYRTNVLASKTIFQCAKDSGARIFYASTVDVYGDIDVPLITENSKPRPISDYAKSKYIAENILKDHSDNYCIGRFAPVYARDFMKDVYKRIYIKQPSLSYLIDDGYDYHFVSVNNVIDFILLWIDKNNNINGTYNVCDTELINSKDFIELEKNEGKIKKVIHLPNYLFQLIRLTLAVGCKLTNSSTLNKIRKSLYKLINPPRYSTQKLNNVISMRWNLKNTVYEDIE